MDAHGRLLLSPGDVVAGYEVEEFVARGGMAVVYRARDRMLNRRVALKLVAPELAGNEKFRQRFIRESELAASIDHPNILPIYSAGEADGLLYIAMRYVDGQDLGAYLAERGPLPPAEVLPIFTQIAAALDTAHAHGLVHRDVKPGNILVAADPGTGGSHVYLTDFGLTKRTSSLSGYTTEGHFIGTIAYVAPEQISGRDVTGRADVYAMGCVLQEAFTGEPPFRRDDDAALLWAHMSVPPPPVTEVRPDLPAAVDDVLAQALAKDPADRQPTCRAVVAELRQAFRSLPSVAAAAAPEPVAETPAPPARPEPEPEPRPRRRIPVLPLLAAVAVVLVAGALLLAPRLFRADTVAYDGEQNGTEWLAFERPRDWAMYTDRVESCFCTGDYSTVFDVGDWATVVDELKRGTSVEGLYAKQVSGVNDPPEAQDAVAYVQPFLNENKKDGFTTARRVTLGERRGWELRGTLIASKNPDLKLAVRYLVLPDADRNSTNLLALFSKDTDADRVAGRLEDVADSVRIRES